MRTWQHHVGSIDPLSTINHLKASEEDDSPVATTSGPLYKPSQVSFSINQVC